MPRNNHAPGRGLRRPPRDAQQERKIQAFVEGLDTPDIPNIRDISDVQSIKDTSVVQSIQLAPKETPRERPETPKASSYASDVVRTDGRKLRRTTLYLKPDLHERLKKAARLTGSDNSTLVNDLLEAHLQTLIQKAIQNL